MSEPGTPQTTTDPHACRRAARLAQRRRSSVRLTAGLAATLILGLAWLRPTSTQDGITPAVFWARKIRWRPVYHCVLVGDSRIYRGVSPSAMQAHLPGWRIANFGFSAAGLSQEYLDASAGLLDPAGPHRVIILGVTPHALTRRALQENGFLELRRTRASELYQTLYAGEILKWFAPYELRTLLSRWRGARYFERYYPDGWVASRRERENPADALARYAEVFTNNPVDHAAARTVLEAVHRWSGAGIRVVGFRPPVTSALAELENRVSGFHEAGFAADFERQGGLWLWVAPGTYHTYDGSHLRFDAALQLSRDLAQQLNRIAQTRPAVQRPRPAFERSLGGTTTPRAAGR